MTKVEFKKAQRANKPLKLGMKGPSGCGKTFSALELATGLVPDGKRIALIDSQYGQSEMYDQQFDFDVLIIPPESTGKEYREALEVAIEAGYGIVIIDSLSQDWEGVIDAESKLPPENMRSWSVAKANTGHKDFLKYLWQYPIDVICTIRCDEAFEVGRDDKGRITKRKVGFKPIQQPRIEYEFDLIFDIEPDTHVAICAGFGKNHTPLWQGEQFVITRDHGQVLRDWKHGGAKWLEPIRGRTKTEINRYIIALEWQRTWRDNLKAAKFEVDSVNDLTQTAAADILNYMKKQVKKNKEAKSG